DIWGGVDAAFRLIRPSTACSTASTVIAPTPSPKSSAHSAVDPALNGRNFIALPWCSCSATTGAPPAAIIWAGPALFATPAARRPETATARKGPLQFG